MYTNCKHTHTHTHTHTHNRLQIGHTRATYAHLLGDDDEAVNSLFCDDVQLSKYSLTHTQLKHSAVM